MEQLQEAARLNSVGASRLASNDRSGAVAILKTAIQIMDTISRAPEVEGHIRSNQEQVAGALDMPESCAVMDDTFFVYNRPLLFQVSPQALDLGFYNAVLMFNLALAFHQEAVHRGQAAKFQKAANLYHLCYNLLAGDATACSGALILAAMNNATHAYLKIGAYDKFREGLQDLEQHAAYYAALQSSPLDAAAPFDAKHFEEFFLNITLAQEPTAAPCA